MTLPSKPLDILREPAVRAALRQAWIESNPGLSGGHEEGGFILCDEAGVLAVQRWPKGEGNSIRVPAHVGCMVDGLAIVATFHTHPNTGPAYLQEPGETDKRGVRDDANLKGSLYLGEFVISEEIIWAVTSAGSVREIGARNELLG